VKNLKLFSFSLFTLHFTEYCGGCAVIVILEDGKKSANSLQCSTVFWGIFLLSLMRTTVSSIHRIHS
jgi:hypothetical protein